MRPKISLLEQALNGRFSDHHAFLAAKMLDRIEALDADIAELDARIEEVSAPFHDQIERIAEIDGVGRRGASAPRAWERSQTGPGYPSLTRPGPCRPARHRETSAAPVGQPSLGGPTTAGPAQHAAPPGQSSAVALIDQRQGR